MSSKGLSLNGKVGTLMALLGAAGYIWTFSSSLRTMELFVPRIALILVVLGGILVPMREKFRPEKTEIFALTGVLPFGIGICVAMWLYSWSFRNIGLMTSTFAFLMVWWLWVIYMECRNKRSFKEFLPKTLKRAVLALVVSFIIQFLFINLLSMYMPRTPMP